MAGSLLCVSRCSRESALGLACHGARRRPVTLSLSCGSVLTLLFCSPVPSTARQGSCHFPEHRLEYPWMCSSKASLFEKQQRSPEEGVFRSLLYLPPSAHAAPRKEQGPFGLCCFSSKAARPVPFDWERGSLVLRVEDFYPRSSCGLKLQSFPG